MRSLRAVAGVLMRGWEHTVGWLLSEVLILVIIGYQRLISPLLPPSCRFYPCCSSYGLTAVRVHGAVKGVILTTWRILRCNPWNAGGLDPVPLAGRWRSDILAADVSSSGEGAHVHP
jgi:uncharacterized protein